MSRYEWESGVIVIPTKDFVSLKKTCRDAYNAYQNNLYKYAVKFYERIIENKPKGRKWQLYISDIRFKAYDMMEDFPEVYRYDIMNVVTKEENQLNNWKPKKPKRSWFPHMKNAKSLTISEDDFTIRLDAESRKLIWKVEENNHAVDHAREHPIAIALWKHINSIVWTRGSGGEIVGNNEYNEDEDTGSRQDNYLVASFSPVKRYLRKY